MSCQRSLQSDKKAYRKSQSSKAVNERITNELVIVKHVKVNPENRIVSFEKLQAKAEQYDRKNNVEISGILNEITEEDLENNVTEISQNFNIIIIMQVSKVFIVCLWDLTAPLIINMRLPSL